MNTEFQSLCQTIVTRVYGALGSTLASDEIVQLASDLAIAIVLALGEADEPVPEVATFAMETFFRSHGIADVGDEWRWVN
jgi:hypothetical protein